ncbi:uncharacterized protein DC041_0007311 [Schistosoma bovis]|uniref:T-box domain-containing protein n=1 Tax=Schistosoma bovis TaxID=6184 RepID=A0A430PYZ1_SCHBO|nr:uncharacterized protein DC041_0007311 [Schistosoma bovis]
MAYLNILNKSTLNSKGDPQITPRIHLHPDGIASGTYWMRQAILFDKLKLTNNPFDQNGHKNL